MIRRWTGIAVVACALALVVVGCSSNDQAAPPQNVEESLPVPTFVAGSSMDRIQKAGKVKVGVKFDQPGFGQRNAATEQLEGFDVEIAKLVAQGIFGGTKSSMDSKVEFVEAVSKNREAFVQNGTVDMVVATYTINDQRKALVDFAGPYYLAHGDVMVKSETTNIRSVSDLNGKNVCIVRNSTYEQSVSEQAPQANAVPRNTYSQCAEALRSGEVQAVATDSVILAGLVQTSQGAFKLLGTSFTDEPYGIGIKKGDDDFRRFLNDRLQAVADSGQWAFAFEATLGRLDLPTPQPPAIDAYGLTADATTTTVPVTTSAAP